MARELCYHLICQALPCGELEELRMVHFLNLADCYVLASSDFISHEVLKKYTNLAIQVFQDILAEILAVDQDLLFRGIVKPCNLFFDVCVALTVFSDQCDPFPRIDMQIVPIEKQPRTSRVPD